MKLRKPDNKQNIILMPVMGVVLIVVLLLIACYIRSDVWSKAREAGNFDLEETYEETHVETTGNNEEKNREVIINVIDNNQASALGIDEKMSEVIKKYFNMYYSSLATLETVPMDSLFYFNTDYEKNLCNSMLKYTNEARAGMDIDLTFDECTIGLKYISMKETDKGIEIYLEENHYMNFNYIPDITSYTSGVEHTFVVDDIEDQYFIVSHSEISGIYKMICGSYNNIVETRGLTDKVLTASQVNDIFNELNENLLRETKSDLHNLYEQKAEYNKNPDKYITALTADNEYNVKAALEYSYKWADKYEILRNPKYYVYDYLGGNCNNYTSQCLFAGGIPMDTKGSIYEQWKWYGDEINFNQSRYGRSMSWTGVDFFYQYCNENSGYGLVCDTKSNIFSGRVGDILQYVSEGIGVHSVIITKIICDEEGNVIDYLINSNTTDRVDYPMSAYGYTTFRLIKIIGWND